MRKRRSFIAVLIVVLLLCDFYSLTAKAAGVDLQKSSSMTITYKDGDKGLSDLEIKTYRIADVSSDGKYSLCGELKGYPINLYDVKSQSEWQNIASTLAAYIAADGIAADLVAKTDDNGIVKYENIMPGMYLILSVTNTYKNEVTVFENFLIAVPNIQEEGSYNYDAAAFPKCEKRQVTQNKIKYSVIKQWKDTGFRDLRPESVKVDILKNGKRQATKLLSADNNWTYKWEADDDDFVWQAVERDISKSYSVTVKSSGNSIIITNIHKEKDSGRPKTGDTTILWPYILVMCISGSILTAIGIWKKRMQDEDK